MIPEYQKSILYSSTMDDVRGDLLRTPHVYEWTHQFLLGNSRCPGLEFTNAFSSCTWIWSMRDFQLAIYQQPNLWSKYYMFRNELENLNNVPYFTASAYLGSYLWTIQNPILEIQVQEWVGEFEARSHYMRYCACWKYAIFWNRL